MSLDAINHLWFRKNHLRKGCAFLVVENRIKFTRVPLVQRSPTNRGVSLCVI
jgi:hypothetical protein